MFILIKANVLIWRLMVNRLSTRCNLVNRGRDMDSVLCPICSDCSESVVYLFFQCSITLDVWRKVASWYLAFPQFSSTAKMFLWVDNRLTAHLEHMITESVFMSVIWVLWTYQNAECVDILTFELLEATYF
ncbi:hypothetical protein LXL04_012157 [Taraxacum kok-saghyz]